MATLNKLRVGQRLFTITSQRMGNTTMRRKAVHYVFVREIDYTKRRVLASWNSNESRWYSERQVLRWKVNEPANQKI